jgi:hypothetical protein
MLCHGSELAFDLLFYFSIVCWGRETMLLVSGVD